MFRERDMYFQEVGVTSDAVQVGPTLNTVVAPGTCPLGHLSIDGFSPAAILPSHTRARVHVTGPLCSLSPLGMYKQSGSVDRYPKLGPAPSISCWKVGLPLPALPCVLLSVSGGCQLQPFRAFCGPWERHPWSWAVAGSAPASRKGNRLAREHRVLSTLTYITGLSYLVNVVSVFFSFLVCLSGMFYRFSETSPTRRSLTSIIW